MWQKPFCQNQCTILYPVYHMLGHKLWERLDIPDTWSKLKLKSVFWFQNKCIGTNQKMCHLMGVDGR